MSEKYRDIENYTVQVAPYQDASTKEIYEKAIYTLGKYSIDIEQKEIYWNFKVWLSQTSFEQGGKSAAIFKEYTLNDRTGLNFDAVMERFPDLKNDTGNSLMELSGELDAGLHNKVETIPDEQV